MVYHVDITKDVIEVSARPAGFGGMADVYKAVWSTSSGRMNVALKVLRVTEDASVKVWRRLRGEIVIWQKLRHPHVQPLYGLYSGFGTLPAMVSPWHETGDITRYFATRPDGPGRDLEKAELLGQTLYGLKYLHDNGIVHSDIKGANVLVSEERQARLCDFGFSAIMTEHTSSFSSRHSSTKGTFRWMAPELFAEDEVRTTKESDIWAYGCLCLEVQSERIPYYDKASDQAVIVALSQQELPTRPPGISDLLWSVVCACCTIYPSLRPSVATVLEWLHIVRLAETWLLLKQHMVLDVLVDAICTSAVKDIASGHTVAHAALRQLADFIQETRVDPQFEDILRAVHDHLLRVLRACISCSGSTPGATATAEAVVPALRLVKASPNARIVSRDLTSALTELCSKPALGPLFKGHTHAVTAVRWLPDGTRLVSASFDKTIRVWDTATGSVSSALLPNHRDGVRDIAVSPDGHFIASCSEDKTVRIWDAGTRRMKSDLRRGHTNSVLCVEFFPDGRRIVTGSCDGTLRIWDVDSTDDDNACSATWRGHTSWVLCVAISRDGTLVASGSAESSIRLWKAATGEQTILGPLRAHVGDVNAVSFLPNGPQLVSGGDDGALRIWDVTTGELVISLEHRDWILAVDCSPDGSRICSASHDGTISLWDGQTRSLLRGPIELHWGPIWSVAFSPDGRRVATGSDDSSIRIWDATLIDD